MRYCIFTFTFFILSIAASSRINSWIGMVGSYDPIYYIDYGFSGESNLAKRVGFRFGFNYHVKTIEQGYIKTGLRYVRQGHQQLNVNLPDPFIYEEYIDEYYFEIPLSFRYDFTKMKFYSYGCFFRKP